MQINKTIYYLKRIKELGFSNTIKRINAKSNQTIYKFYWKSKAKKLKANHIWNQISNIKFEVYLQNLKQKDFINKILKSNEFKVFLNQKSKSNKFCYVNYKNTNYKLLSKTFYQNIKIEQKQIENLKEFNFDIKIPWEESRFQDIFIWKNSNSDITFYNQINNWINNNPYLLGINWFCPMEVAIRAINWIYGFYFFKDSKNIPKYFWKKLICSLYDHAKYLQNNWETSDKPNNHYLADLIGYLYLCFFLQDLKHFKKEKIKTIKKILEQFDHQIQNDGTSYEGSTNYHKLNTEIFLHFYILCKTNNLQLPQHFESKLQKMIQFISTCSDQNGNLIQIGDNDSGKILTGLNKILPNQKKNIDQNLFHYPNFGLTIIKNKNWHITLRHPTFNKKQPTGHFHQDELTMTLSINGIPILIDPGTYTYTANTKWRNFFRSIKNHNTFYIPSLETKLKNIDLFQLSKKEHPDATKIKNTNHLIEIESSCYKYYNFGLTQFRKIIFCKKDTLKINDWYNTKHPLISYWNLIFHPKIKLKKTKKNLYKISINQKDFVSLESNLNFKVKTGFYSKEYGELEKCIKLVAQKKTDSIKSIILIKKI
ncbi:hypothetical protein GF322_02020 [Candidatus Dependentiae bacterium]|nr:hypothetical protein [Candidatus Dependentiae bacterium]